MQKKLTKNSFVVFDSFLYTVHVSFLCLDKLSCPFLSIIHLPVFYSCYVNVIKHLQEFLSCEIFANFTSADACPSFSSHPLSFMLISLLSLSFSAHSKAWIRRVSTFSQSVISSRSPFDFFLIYSIITFHLFVAILYLLTNFLFQLLSFVKYRIAWSVSQIHHGSIPLRVCCAPLGLWHWAWYLGHHSVW